jgi:hypothetical protein
MSAAWSNGGSGADKSKIKISPPKLTFRLIVTELAYRIIFDPRLDNAWIDRPYTHLKKSPNISYPEFERIESKENESAL